MPKNKNSNVSKSPFRDLRNPRELSHNQETASSQPRDCRSKEEKVSDLTDLFIGDHHIDTDIIHAVLEECKWNVEDATEKLFEVFFTNSKPVQSKQRDSNSLANIAVSILLDKTSDSEKDVNFTTTNFDYDMPNLAEDVNNSSSAVNRKESNNMRPKISSNENLVQYDNPNRNADSKPSTESKTLFECTSSQRDFYNKNSFGDMAVNMEHYKKDVSMSVTKTSNLNGVKDDLSVESSINRALPVNQPSPAVSVKTKPRIDLSKVSVDAVPSMNNVENNSFDEMKSASTFYSDKSMESLFSGGQSPSTVEWNKFYKQLDLQPVQTEKVYPDISANELLVGSKDCDASLLVSSMDGFKPFSQDETVNQSGNTTLSDSKKDNRSSRLQIPKSGMKGHVGNTLTSGTDLMENKSVISKELNTTEREEKTSPSKFAFSPEAPTFVPRVLGAKQPMPRKSPTKQSKSSTKALPSTDNRSFSSDKSHVFKKVNKNLESLFTASGPKAQVIDPMDPLGWEEIRSMTSHKAHKSDFRINANLNLPPNHKPNNPSIDFHEKSNLADCGDNISDRAAIPPFNLKAAASQTNKTKKIIQKKKEKGSLTNKADCPTTSHKVDKSDIKTDSSDNDHQSNNTNTPFIHSDSSDFPLPPPTSLNTSSLSLPPSLRKKQNSLHLSTPPLSQRDNTRKRDVVSHMVPKGHTVHEEKSVVNQVEFVGVKTPLGKLKHYIDKKQAVMFILRGLPGSGKSYLAGQMVVESNRMNIEAKSLSSDAFFTSSGQYNFNVDQLSEAHNWNRQRAQESLKNKQPVIIIDNTNTTMWEMLPYAEMAILNGYDVQVCEPDTHWKTKVPELARRNQHGVTKEHIKRMKERYENVGTEEVLKAATKSLMGKNKFPSNCKTVKNPPMKDHKFIPKDRSQASRPQPNSDIVNPPVLNANPLHVLGGVDKDASSGTDSGFTQWIPAMEQRDTTRKAKRSGGVVEENSTTREITLDFLNNSIKKALVDIETKQESKKGDLVDNRPEKTGDIETGSLAHDNERTNQKANIGEKKEGTEVSEIKIEFSTDTGEVSKVTDKEVKESSDLPMVLPVTMDKTGCSLDVSNLLLPAMKLDNSGSSTGELYYSCGSHDGDDLEDVEENGRKRDKDKDCLNADAGQMTNSTIIPKSDETEISDCLHDQDPEGLACQVEECDVVDDNRLSIIDDDLPFDKPTILGETSQKHEHSLETDGHQMTRCASGAEDKGVNAGHIKVDMKSEGGMEDALLPSSDQSQRLSLVVYSDSEDEENDASVVEESLDTLDQKVNTSHINKIDPKPVTINTLGGSVCDYDEIVSEDAKNGLEERCTDRNLRGTELAFTLPVCDTVDDEEKIIVELDVQKDQDLINASESSRDIDETTPSSGIIESAESSSSTREPSPAPTECLEYSYIRKKKKKKVKPVENTNGPFLEDALKEKSKTENWSKFFFKDSQSLESESPTSPIKRDSQATTSDASCQCESYYFSMVYRLNSLVFSNQQPMDISNLDVQVIQTSTSLTELWTDRFCSDTIVQRKSDTTDRSTLTDEMLDSEQVDLETLQNCFPEYSKKQLEEVMAVCHNDLEWVTNNLMDAPPVIIDTEEEQDDAKEESDELELENERCQVVKNVNSVKSLAQLCREVVESNQVLDADDFEQQVIDASQTRLEEIEKFAWVRMHSYSLDSSHASSSATRKADIWPDDFNLGAFSGSYGLDDFRGDPHKSVKPRSRSAKSDDKVLVDTSDIGINKRQQIHQRPHQSIKTVTPSVPVLPVEFIKSLEMNYGSLNTGLNDYGLELDDSTARKIYNSLKLLISKKHVQGGSEQEKQVREDEAMARALQEAEDKSRHHSVSPNYSVQGWTSDVPSWMSANTSPQASVLVTENKQTSRMNASRLNSVSDTLHNLRGAWPKRLKPFKFHSQIHRQQDFSVWANKSVSGPRVANMHSIMQEEMEREARMRKHLVTTRAHVDSDDLATKIKRSKLGQMFPSLSADVLEEIFINNGYSLETTVKCLESEYDHEPVHVSAEQEEEEVNRIIRQNEKESQNSASYHYQYEDVDNVSYEDLRKEAQFYDKLANECRQKAHRHHGDGMHHVAFFYRQEVKKYLSEKDYANQRAARLLFDKGSERLLRENTLDLHSYHISEAIEAVNLALEIMKEEYRGQSERKRRYLTVITGRGKNSKWGVPKLKPAIISHLNNKNMRFEEMAPGMFKVHLFQE